MTYVRGTGEIDNKPKSKIKKSKIALIIIAVLGLGVLSQFIVPILNTPVEKDTNVIELNNDGVSVLEAEAADQKIAKFATNQAATFTNTTKPTDSDDSEPHPIIESNKTDNEALTTESETAPLVATSSNSDTDVIPFAAQIQTDIPNEYPQIEQISDSTAYTDIVSAEELLLNSAMPATDSEHYTKVENNSTMVQSERLSAPEEINIESRHEVQNEVKPDIRPIPASAQSFKPEEYGMPNEDVQQLKVAEIQNYIRNSRLNPESVGEFGRTYAVDESNNQLKNYVGEAKETEYQMQDQNTVYLYSNFAAKIYLLPLEKNDTVNAYLSDPKGWEVKLLPGGIFRINRSDDKAKWTQATDLFIIAGKRTYTIILQGVGETCAD